jgi:hypothetical protein
MDQNTQAQIAQLLAIAQGGHPLQAPAALQRAQQLMTAPPPPPSQQYSGGYSREPFPVGHSVIQVDQVHPPLGLNTVQASMAPSRILVVPDIQNAGPLSTTPGARLEFSSGGGWLIGWRGTAVDLTPGAQAAGLLQQAQAGVQMTINDGENLITNGVGVDFSRFSDLFPSSSQWSPIMRRVDVKDTLNLTFRNFNADAGQGTPIYAFSLSFFFWREKYPGQG